MQGPGDHVVNLRRRFRFDADHAQIKGRFTAVVVHRQGVARALARPPRQPIQPFGQLAPILIQFRWLHDQHQLGLPFPVTVPLNQCRRCQVDVSGDGTSSSDQ